MTRQLTHTKIQERKAQKRAARAWKGLVATTVPQEVPMKKQYDFKNGERGRFAKKSPTLEGRGVQTMHPRIINVSFDVTQEVAAALRALRDTGLFGNGVDCASVAEELLRRALRQPDVLEHWSPAKTSVQSLAAARINLRASATNFVNTTRTAKGAGHDSTTRKRPRQKQKPRRAR